MAAAYDRALKRVNAVSEAVLAELIERDVQQLTERALGVLRSAPVDSVHGPDVLPVSPIRAFGTSTGRSSAVARVSAPSRLFWSLPSSGKTAAA